MSTEADIVERLVQDHQQLRKMTEAAHFAGKETGVRVRDTSALLQDLDDAVAEIARLRAERAAAAQHKDRADLLLAAARSAAVQCGNVIFNCRQVPSSNERHLASWESVQGCLDAAIHLAADTKPATLIATDQTGGAT